jgi:hypothetical protein
MLRYLAVGVIAVLPLLTPEPAAAQAGKAYRVRLSPVPVDLPMLPTIAGSGSVTATLTGRSIVGSGAFAVRPSSI